MSNYRKQIDRELAHAEVSRAQGLEGRARVCARRAAGMAARAYLENRGAPIPTFNALELLASLSAQEDLPGEAHRIIQHLLMRVTPDYQLPETVDLIAEARALSSLLVD